MKVYLKNGNYALSKDFPMDVLEMRDTLDRLRKFQSRKVSFKLSEFDNMELPLKLCGREYSADIYKLNLFAERLEKLRSSEMAAFKSLLKANPESSFEDMLLMTYGLDCVPVWPCSDFSELGETMIENDMVEELNEIPDECIGLIDREKIGRLCQEREGGIFVDGYYCVPSSYEPPDIDFEFGEPERCFFRLLIAPNAQKTAQAQWISLPCDAETLTGVYDQTCCELQSALPQITPDSLKNMRQIGELNAVAERLSELSHDDFIKLKAVMESENICDISDTMDCIEHLSEYEFDMFVSDENGFGRTYLAENLPTDFDTSVLDEVDLYDLSEKIMERTGSKMTSYGAISIRGQSLYPVITVQSEQQLTEDISEEPQEDECEEFEMGGLSM